MHKVFTVRDGSELEVFSGTWSKCLNYCRQRNWKCIAPRWVLEVTVQEGEVVKILYAIKKKNTRYFVCKWDCGFYSIERITKTIGVSLIFKPTLEEIEQYIKENNYKKVA